MKVRLLYENSEYGDECVCMNKNDIIKDLNLDIIFKFMARSDPFLYKTSKAVMTNCVTKSSTILYRQEILKDCLMNFEIFEELYGMASKTMEATHNFTESVKKFSYNKVSNSVSVLHSLELLGILVENLEKVKSYLDKIEIKLQSPGMRGFYERLSHEYSSQFVESMRASLTDMNFLTEGGEITFSAGVGQGLKSMDIIVNGLSKEEFRKRRSKSKAVVLYYKLFKRNIILLQDSRLEHDVRELEAAGMSHIMKLYQNFIRELTAFFENLHFQTAFYVGCANLRNRLMQMNIATGFPMISDKEPEEFEFRDLYDLSLAIYKRRTPVSNDLRCEGTKLFIITGANQGGKTTYLRSIGIAQIMLQSGMFVPARYYCSNLYDGIFSHFTRREETAMNSGKLDEELSRMSGILNEISPKSLLLLNESFATTTEREGSQIASEVVQALFEYGVKTIMVTHLFEFTRSIYKKKPEHTKFLSAERLPDGIRTFRILEKEPERTSYGLDLFSEIIGELI